MVLERTGTDITPNGLIKISGWVRPENIAEAQETLGRLARSGADEWSLPAMASLIDAVSMHAERVVRLLAEEEYAGQWIRSGLVAERVELSSARLAGALALIKKEASARNLPSPIASAIRRTEDGSPARHVRLTREIADLVPPGPTRRPIPKKRRKVIQSQPAGAAR